MAFYSSCTFTCYSWKSSLSLPLFIFLSLFFSLFLLNSFLHSFDYLDSCDVSSFYSISPLLTLLVTFLCMCMLFFLLSSLFPLTISFVDVRLMSPFTAPTGTSVLYVCTVRLSALSTDRCTVSLCFDDFINTSHLSRVLRSSSHFISHLSQVLFFSLSFSPTSCLCLTSFPLIALASTHTWSFLHITVDFFFASRSRRLVSLSLSLSLSLSPLLTPLSIAQQLTVPSLSANWLMLVSIFLFACVNANSPSLSVVFIVELQMFAHTYISKLFNWCQVLRVSCDDNYFKAIFIYQLVWVSLWQWDRECVSVCECVCVSVSVC